MIKKIPLPLGEGWVRVEGLPANILGEFDPHPTLHFAALIERRPLPEGEARSGKLGFISP
jgi:hypothetical protein